jgi:intraflagellar transport protein 81
MQMPEELNFDADIASIKDEIKAMQAEFVEVHKQTDSVRVVTKCAPNTHAAF